MTAWREVLIDTWSSLSHKLPLQEDATARQNGWSPGSWIPERDRRRITAYTVLAGYDENVSRSFVADPDEGSDRREYGDASLLIDTTLSHLLGEDQRVAVAGAERYDGELSEDATAEEKAANDAAKVLVDLQSDLEAWGEKVQLALKTQDCERRSVRDGDGVYLIGWDAAKKRPTLAVLDAGFYFPVLPDSLDATEYPTKVHLAWEIPAEDDPDGVAKVRRITYELGPIEPALGEDGEPVATEEGAEGLTRRYPWQASDEDPSGITCYLTDGTWPLDKSVAGVDYLSPEAGTYAVDGEGNALYRLDISADFIPVVHIPNTPAGGAHFGQSSLAKVLQLLDDLQMADTDSNAASSTTGSPIIVLHGASLGPGGTRRVAAGEVWEVGADGGMDVLNTSEQLKEQRAYVADLADRLSINSRLPAVVTGRATAGEAISGYTMRLSFGPLEAMIRAMRLTRAVKYPLVFKFAMRFMQIGGTLPAGELPKATLQFGSYMPLDAQQLLTDAATAYGAGIISLETAVATAIEAGFEIEDIAEEITRIQSRDFARANLLADATNDQDAVRAFLNLPEAEEEAPVAAPAIPTAPVVDTGVPGIPPAADPTLAPISAVPGDPAADVVPPA